MYLSIFIRRRRAYEEWRVLEAWGEVVWRTDEDVLGRLMEDEEEGMWDDDDLL